MGKTSILFIGHGRLVYKKSITKEQAKVAGSPEEWAVLGWQQRERAASAAAGRVLPLHPPAVTILPSSPVPPAQLHRPLALVVSGHVVCISTFLKIQFNLIHMHLLLKQYMVTLYHLIYNHPWKKKPEQDGFFFFFFTHGELVRLCCALQCKASTSSSYNFFSVHEYSKTQKVYEKYVV